MLKRQHQQCLSTLLTRPELLISLSAVVAAITTTESVGREPLRRFFLYFHHSWGGQRLSGSVCNRVDIRRGDGGHRGDQTGVLLPLVHTSRFRMSHCYRSCLQVMSTGGGKGGGPQLLSFLSGICGGREGATESGSTMESNVQHHNRREAT